MQSPIQVDLPLLICSAFFLVRETYKEKRGVGCDHNGCIRSFPFIWLVPCINRGSFHLCIPVFILSIPVQTSKNDDPNHEKVATFTNEWNAPSSKWNKPEASVTSVPSVCFSNYPPDDLSQAISQSGRQSELSNPSITKTIGKPRSSHLMWALKHVFFLKKKCKVWVQSWISEGSINTIIKKAVGLPHLGTWIRIPQLCLTVTTLVILSGASPCVKPGWIELAQLA